MRVAPQMPPQIPRPGAATVHNQISRHNNIIEVAQDTPPHLKIFLYFLTEIVVLVIFVVPVTEIYYSVHNYKLRTEPTEVKMCNLQISICYL